MSDYQGWTNYETWCANLHIRNDQNSLKYWERLARAIWLESGDSGMFTKLENAIERLAEKMKDHFERRNPLEHAANMYGDLLRAALSEVNWREIAGDFMEVRTEA